MNARTLALKTHPRTPCAAIDRLYVTLTYPHPGRLHAAYTLYGRPERIRLPNNPAIRTDALWQHTCMELFLRTHADAYLEYNFSPSGAWAAYAFDAYRQGMRPLNIRAPEIVWQATAECMTLKVAIDLPRADTPLRIGLCGVIEDTEGRLAYWALRHPTTHPDFHHPAAFVAL